ncbi:MAG: segregation and condensation protein A [Christensenellales bacterium]
MAYAFKLESFEGPLDLLLHLIAKAQVDIKDIFVSEITDQYLAYLEQMEQLDMEQASEFLTMAATLLNIKSRSLLPKPEAPEEEDPEALLILQLEEYKKIKQASLVLQEMEKARRKAILSCRKNMPFSKTR